MEIVESPPSEQQYAHKTAEYTPAKSKIDEPIELNNTKENDSRLSSHYYYSSGNFHFIVDKSFKPETIEEVNITKVPFLPSWYEGILSIHGMIIPVIDIIKFARHEHMKVSSQKSTKRYFLKLEHKNHRPIVFILDSLPKLVDTKKLQNNQTQNDSPMWIKHFLSDSEKQIAVIDSNNLFKSIMNNQ